MRIHVLFFAQLRQEFGEGRELDLPEGSKVADACRSLFGEAWERRVKDLALALAVNLETVGLGGALASGDELALLPPVSGG